jgi:flagellar motility protein MotE (MotC chaperone)
LRQLKARQASLILNEMKPEQAAVLVKSIAAATKQETKPK